MQKEEHLTEGRFLELSRLATHQGRITYSDFLNLNELHILHTMPKADLLSGYVTFGGYAQAERQMAAFLPDALYLCEEKPAYPFCMLSVTPLQRKFAEELSHRDYLGAILHLGIERSKIGDILVEEKGAFLFAHTSLEAFLVTELTRIRHTTMMVESVQRESFVYTPHFEEIRGTIASVRLDSLLSLVFSSSRSQLTGLIEGGKVFVNGRLITSNGYKLKEEDIISVRGKGKFQYKGVLHTTKKNRLLVSVHKYA